MPGNSVSRVWVTVSIRKSYTPISNASREARFMCKCTRSKISTKASTPDNKPLRIHLRKSNSVIYCLADHHFNIRNESKIQKPGLVNHQTSSLQSSDRPCNCPLTWSFKYEHIIATGHGCHCYFMVGGFSTSIKTR